MLGRRRRRHPSLDAFAVLAAPTETRQRADSPFIPHVTERRPVTRLSHLATLSTVQQYRVRQRSCQKPPRNHFERGQHLHHLATSSAPDDLVELVPRRANVGAIAKTPPFARCLRRNHWTNRDKTTDRLTLRPIRHRTKTCDEVVSSCDLVQDGGQSVIRPIVTGPAWPLCVTSLICKGTSVITVCNPTL